MWKLCLVVMIPLKIKYKEKVTYPKVTDLQFCSVSYIHFVLMESVQLYSQHLIRGKIYPELPELVPVVLSVCQSFYCDHPFRDLSLSSNTWLQAKNWHARKQIWFKDILKLQKWGKSLSGFPGLFSRVCLRKSLGIWGSLQYLGEGLGIAAPAAGDADFSASPGDALSCWGI